ncbi:MAG: hypothetical protein KDC24_09485 [Saprospiraceae bacterium]|nr:hypothetical protein [Saprospiraceae bacterium]
MIKFFRIIRQQLLSDNKVSKYLLYALGEIVLVIIGILLALQINDWSTNQQHKKEEKRILQSIKTDVTNDTLQLSKNIANAKNRIAQIDTVYIALNHPEQFSSGQFLQYAYALASSQQFNVNSGTFDESLSSGFLKYIENDQLRQNIFEYYRKAKIQSIDKYAVQQNYDVVFPVMFKKLSTTKDFFEGFIRQPTQFKPIDIKSLSTDIEFVAAVNQRFASEKTQISYWGGFLKTSKQLIREIDEELNK